MKIGYSIYFPVCGYLIQLYGTYAAFNRCYWNKINALVPREKVTESILLLFI
jgi:hypothetical protein